MQGPIPRLSAALDGRYRIEGELGTGGMATVYLAFDVRHGRKVALKVLHPELTKVVAGQRFLSEIRTTASLQHPHIVSLFDSGEADGYLYYAMSYVEGESLRERLEREGALPLEDALEIAAELAGALDHAHRQGVVHRDIKPENVLLHPKHGAVISDFGIALALDAAGATRITVTGQPVGTPHYMSPEQVTAETIVDGRSDIYSLACVLHEMLTGEPMFTAKSARYLQAKHLFADPIAVRTVRSDVPEALDDAIARGLKKVPAERFQTMGEFADALAAAASPTPTFRAAWTWSRAWLGRHPFAATAAALVVVGTAFVAAPFLGGPAWTDRPSSIAVLPFRESVSTEEDERLAIQLADLIGRELQRWEGLTVATDVDLAGPRRDMGLAEPILERSGDGASLARGADAEAMLALTVRQRGDSVSLQTSLFDSRTGRRVGDPTMATGVLDGSSSSSLNVIAPIVASVLGFVDAPRPERAIAAGTGNPDAAVAYLRGREALERNRLDEAEALFTQAIRSDSAFASALSFLGQTHFWQGVENGYYFISQGPEMSRWSTAATRHLEGLSRQNEEHVRAFYALQLGDMEEARRRYRAIVEDAGEDAYASLMLGEIDMIDRWSVRGTEGGLQPRSDLNRARRAFSGVVRMEPTFELAYDGLFSLQRLVETTSCEGFEVFRGELRPIWRPRVPGPDMYPLCAAALDSIEWLPSRGTVDEITLQAGADRLFRQVEGELTRWATFAPEQPRPLEILSDAYLLRRRQLRLATPERLQALADEALQYRERAIALQSDTTAADLVALANLQMAAGDLPAAVENARKALDIYSTSSSDGTAISAPDALINVLVVAGQVSSALAVADGLRGDGGYMSARYITDPRTGANVAVASGGPIMARLRILAAAGVSGPPVRAELQRLDEAWAAEGYPPAWQQLLRDRFTMQIAPSMAFDSTALAAWSSGVSVDDPTWLALTLSRSDPSRAARALDRARDLGRSNPDVSSSFLLGVAAGRLGRPSEAVALYSRLDSIPSITDGFVQTWGLRVLSHFLRAQQYEELGEDAMAIAHYQQFIEARSWPDSLSAPLLEEAKQSVSRIEGRSTG